MRCRSCGAHIRWARTLSGKPIPLDDAPVANGNVRLVPDTGGVRAVVLAGDDLRRAHTAGEGLYYPHHGSCPHGRRWRR